MEKIYYDRSNDKAFREDQSDIANKNKPEFKYKTIRDLAWQYLNSTRKDSATGLFNDFYTGFSGLTITPSFAIDNNKLHVFSGKLNAGATGSVSTIEVKELAGVPSDGLRVMGTIELTNGALETENVNYNTFVLAGSVYTFTLADANFVKGAQALTYTYLADDPARAKELPITKTQSANIDQTDKDTGLFIITVDSKKEIFRELVEGSEEITDCEGGLQIVESGELLEEKTIGVRCLGLLDDDGGIGPAPDQDYYDIAEIDNIVDGLQVKQQFIISGIDFTATAQTVIFTVPAGKKFKPEYGDDLTDTIIGASTPHSYKWLADATELLPSIPSTMGAVGEFDSAELDPVKYWPSGTVFKYEVTVAGLSTTHTGKAILKGTLIDE